MISGLKKLRVLFGESVVNAKTVTGMLRSKWESDPYSKGGYSYVAVGRSLLYINNHNVRDKLRSKWTNGSYTKGGKSYMAACT